MKLSNNFTLKEMCKSATAVRLGIDNTPTEQNMQGLKNLCIGVLQPARLALGRISVNSGYRSPELCKAIGSNSRSNHAFGFAGDVEPEVDGVSNFDLLLWIYENCEFKELIAEYFDSGDEDAGWVHVAYQEGNNKGVIKVKDKEHNYRVVSIDYLKMLYG